MSETKDVCYVPSKQLPEKKKKVDPRTTAKLLTDVRERLMSVHNKQYILEGRSDTMQESIDLLQAKVAALGMKQTTPKEHPQGYKHSMSNGACLTSMILVMAFTWVLVSPVGAVISDDCKFPDPCILIQPGAKYNCTCIDPYTLKGNVFKGHNCVNLDLYKQYGGHVEGETEVELDEVLPTSGENETLTLLPYVVELLLNQKKACEFTWSCDYVPNTGRYYRLSALYNYLNAANCTYTQFNGSIPLDDGGYPADTPGPPDYEDGYGTDGWGSGSDGEDLPIPDDEDVWIPGTPLPNQTIPG